MHTAIYWRAGATAADDADDLINIIIYYFEPFPSAADRGRESLLWDLNALERVHVCFCPNDFAI